MLPTQKLYQTVDRNGYDATMNVELHSKWQRDYFQMKPRDKWLHLRSQFELLWPEHYNEIVPFFQRRLDTVESPTNIPLVTCINYFEQFYFLYTTENSFFKLDDPEKRQLRLDLLEAMMSFVCEPGLRERFEDNLAQYRRDTNWIAYSLSLARHRVLTGLAEQCNVSLGIHQGLSVHTNKLMRELAFNKELGIEIDTNLTDAYQWLVQTSEITRYFKSHYAAAFHAYEDSAADDLSEKLLEEFTEFLKTKKVEVEQWENECIVLPPENLADLNRFFEEKSFNTFVNDLFDDEADDTIRFKTKADFKCGLRSLVNKKLIEQGYYLSIANVLELTSTALPALPIWHAGPSIQDYAALNRARHKSMPDFYAGLKQHALSLLKDPRFVLACVESSPAILEVLPDEYRANAHFIDKALAVVSAKVLMAIAANDDEQVKRLINYLLAFLPRTFHDVSYFSSLPPEVLKHDSVDLALRTRNQLFDEVLVEQAPLGLYDMKQVSALTLESLTQNLDPTYLLHIVQHRKANSLSPLPYCDHLQAFCDDLRQARISWNSADEYWAAKRRAEDVYATDTVLHEASAVGHLARTHSLYMALVKYHHANQLAFQTWSAFFDLLQKIIVGMVKSMTFSLVLLGLCAASVSAFACIYLGLQFGLLFAEIALLGSVLFPIQSSAVFVLLLFFNVCLTLAILSVAFGWLEEHCLLPLKLFCIIEAQAEFKQLATHAYALIAGIYATVFSPAEPLAMDLLKTRCERSIERLRFKKIDASANQKGLLLNTLWDKVQNEEDSDSDSEAKLKARLSQKYEVSYQGGIHMLSFSEVASIKRRHADRFNLDDPPSVYGFFAQNRATTTDSILAQRAGYEILL